ncbi:MAG: hypothetical protein WD995_04455 [Gemmatimonadota bacterium]
MKLVATEKREQNRALVDPWTAVHLAAGLAAGLVGVRRDVSLSTAVAYEVVEQYVERQGWGQEFFQTSRHESLSNAVIDVAAFALGHWLGEAWNGSGRST